VVARDDGTDDGHAGLAQDVADDGGELDVHLFHRLLHVLHLAARRGDERRAVPCQVSAYVCTQNGAMPTYPEELLK